MKNDYHSLLSFATHFKKIIFCILLMHCLDCLSLVELMCVSVCVVCVHKSGSLIKRPATLQDWISDLKVKSHLAVITKLCSIIVLLKKKKKNWDSWHLVPPHLKPFKQLGDKKGLFLGSEQNSRCVSLKDLEIFCKIHCSKMVRIYLYWNKMLNHLFSLLQIFPWPI